MSDLTEDARRAREANLTYGQYMAARYRSLPKPVEGKRCKACGALLRRKQKLYCSQMCGRLYRREQAVWKEARA